MPVLLCNNKDTDGFKIYNLGLDNSWLGSNPWLSGFIESDGNFIVNLN
jgi:hypothetical protein